MPLLSEARYSQARTMLLAMLSQAVAAALWLPEVVLNLKRKIEVAFYRKPLQGKVVLITGASSGIGRALAFELYRRGCRLLLASRQTEQLEVLKQKIASADPSTAPAPAPPTPPVVLPLDLSRPEDIVARAAEAEAVHGRIDVLVNCGGVSVRGDVETTRMDVFRRVMDVNFFGLVELTKCLLPGMKRNVDGGLVVNISSLQGLVALPQRAAYSASKHAVQAFSDSLRAEGAGDKIKVTNVSPGYVNTSLSVNAITGSGGTHGVMDEGQKHGYSAEDVAVTIAEAMEMEEKEVVIATPAYRLFIMVRQLFPWLYFKAMEFRASTLPKTE